MLINIDKTKKTIHFIGIGGIGMSGIAELMLNQGYRIQGSDISLNNNVRRLKQKKIKIFLNHKKSNIDNVHTVVYSSAIKKNNPEIKACKKLGIPIVATSGNIHGSPIISNDNDAHKQLNEVADYFLHHNLDIQFPQDDSVVTFAESSQLILRRSRGLAPNYINTTINSKKPILAMGGHLKSTFTFVPNAQTYVSQYFGNLDNYEVLKRYQATIEDYVALFETKPKTILIDKHTQYQSSILGKELALEWNADIQEIQHHKAHFASVLGEHDLFDSKEKILGLVWDGTGFGEGYYSNEVVPYIQNILKPITTLFFLPMQ